MEVEKLKIVDPQIFDIKDSLHNELKAAIFQKFGSDTPELRPASGIRVVSTVGVVPRDLHFYIRAKTEWRNNGEKFDSVAFRQHDGALAFGKCKIFGHFRETGWIVALVDMFEIIGSHPIHNSPLVSPSTTTVLIPATSILYPICLRPAWGKGAPEGICWVDEVIFDFIHRALWEWWWIHKSIIHTTLFMSNYQCWSEGHTHGCPFDVEKIDVSATRWGHVKRASQHR